MSLFNSCTSANRIVTQPLLTRFTRSFVKVDASTDDHSYYLYTRIRQAQYRYVGCTKSAALTKANALNLLFNRKVVKDWQYDVLDHSWKPYNLSYDQRFARKQVGTAVVRKEDGDSYSVDVELSEELTSRYTTVRSGTGTGEYAKYPAWAAFEADPDIATDRFALWNNLDYDYDGII